MLIFDLESNGLLDQLTTIHCLVLHDTDRGETYVFNNEGDLPPVSDGIKALEEADHICGHNIMRFDIPAIQKIYPEFNPKGRLWDTLIMSRLMWTNIKDIDFAKRKKQPDAAMPGHLIGRHSLEAWGHRLGEHKGDYKGGWESWNQDMEDYCVQDIVVTTKLWNLIESKDYSDQAIQLEHDVQQIIGRQEDYGFCFDVDGCQKLYSTLVKRKLEVETELKKVFEPWYQSAGKFTPKRGNKTRGYEADCSLTKVVLTEFNPGSRDHIANRLIKMRGWKPKAFGKDGKPTVDESTLKGLPYPEVPLLIEYLMLGKRLGQLAEGKEAWLKAEKGGRIYGRVNTNGAVTGRMTHSKPNVAQVPSCGAPWGNECRQLFRATPGMVMVGADASGLELRMLASYMNDPDYTNEILSGDIHTKNQHAAGLPDRPSSKRFIYSFLYGAGDPLVGEIIGKGPRAGKAIKQKFLDNTPALKKLMAGVQKAAKRGYLKGLDGRHIHVRSPHAALNSLLQGAGAAVMKVALVILDGNLQEAGHKPGIDYEFVANVHDEFQIEARPDIADDVGRAAVAAIQEAGRHLNLKCPLDGEYKVGATWADTH